MPRAREPASQPRRCKGGFEAPHMALSGGTNDGWRRGGGGMARGIPQLSEEEGRFQSIRNGSAKWSKGPFIRWRMIGESLSSA